MPCLPGTQCDTLVGTQHVADIFGEAAVEADVNRSTQVADREIRGLARIEHDHAGGSLRGQFR